MLEDFKRLPVWQQFEKAKAEENIDFNPDRLFYDAVSLLDQYYVAFPKYTLHNSRHQKNILRIMGELLGNDITKLTALECAFLILSAAYHDIGMVYNETQLAAIQTEETFPQFLDGNYKAKLQYEENHKQLTDDLAGWYCRWMHAKRVWLFLKNNEDLKWKSISLKNQLGKLCESHNEDAMALVNDDEFPTDFLDRADIRFCGVLLRLADIMDFDNSRTPKSVYEYLELGNPKNGSEKISSDEWNKHLCSDGFTVKHRNNERPELRFQAGPPYPEIEKNINTFLDVIENELLKCHRVVDKCSERWRGFRLPGNINRNGIISEGYKKGNYRLSLDEAQIINLLTGENLYESEFVFIRELLQNAIDTSRMREFHEQANGNASFKADPIRISTWVDDAGYRWVRVDDYGMGMNEYVIENHLLRKGNSFYKSDYYRLQKNVYKDKLDLDFTPISRFGIGLLSCFMLGDAIEISSMSVPVAATQSGVEKNRLSIQGLHGYYVLQTEKEKHDPLPMPHPYTAAEKYRAECGTSIAIRISSTKDHLDFEERLSKTINEYIVCSPIDVFFSGQKIGLDFNKTLYSPLAESHFFPFSLDDQRSINNLLFGYQLVSTIGIMVLAIDFTENSGTSNLKGQGVILRLACSDLGHLLQDKRREAIVESLNSWSYSIYLGINKKVIEFKGGSYNNTRSFTVEIDEAFQAIRNLKLFETLSLDNKSNRSEYKSGFTLVHNGIKVPNNTGQNITVAIDKQKAGSLDFISGSAWYSGLIYLQDDLIPNLSVARNEIKELGFNIYSALYYASRELNGILNERSAYDYLLSNHRNGEFATKEVLYDKLVCSAKWANEKVIETISGSQTILLSLAEVKQKMNSGPVYFRFSRHSHFLNALSRGLMSCEFDFEYLVKEKYFKIKEVKKNHSFQSLPDRFYPFDTSHVLADSGMINQKHWLGAWLELHRYYLKRNFKSYFNSIINLIVDRNAERINKILDHFRRVLPQDAQLPDIAITEKDYLSKE